MLTVEFFTTATALLLITTLPEVAVSTALSRTRIDALALEMTPEPNRLNVPAGEESMFVVRVGSRLTILPVASVYGRAAPSFTNTSGGASLPTTARSGRPSAVRSAAARAATPFDVNPSETRSYLV